MPVGAKRRKRGQPERVLDLPPPYRLVPLREVGDAFEHARKIAPTGGAGTLVYVGRFDLAEFAVVLEPEEPLRAARRAFYAGMVALAEALASHAPPERPIAFDWPDAIRVDGGVVGGGRLGWPAGAKEEEPPDWLVFAAMIRTVAMGEYSAGLLPLGTALETEGFDGVDSARLVESFARHLMLVTDGWRDLGFGAVANAYLSRLPRDAGEVLQLDGEGSLLVRRKGEASAERRGLADALAAPAWLDAATGTVVR